MEAIGSDPTDTLLSYLPPVGWADVATARDVQALGAEVRGEMAALAAEFRAELHHELRVQFYWTATLLLAIVAIVLTVSATGLLG